MQEVINLILIFAWGIILGFFYQVMAAISKRHEKLTYLLWSLTGILFFFATASFLFYLNRGAVGLYGFPIMVLGFLLYIHFFGGRAAPVLRRAEHNSRRFLRVCKSVLQFFIRVFLAPLACLATAAKIIIEAVAAIFGKIFFKFIHAEEKEAESEV